MADTRPSNEHAARTVREQIVFTGRVHGVGFRATARSIALRCDVTGWVRNQPDGSVMLEAQGPQHEIDSLIREIDSEMGRLITDIRRAEMPISRDESAFEIRR
ncbi:MAG: acylphosphatase [Planctomycetota bacterium]